MTCQQVQTQLSLYLYGELDFAGEEAIEQHLDSCAVCVVALAREKKWFGTVNSVQLDVPLELLSQCRADLRGTDSVDRTPRFSVWGSLAGLRPWLPRLSSSWSVQLAAASLFLFLGFGAGQLWVQLKPGLSKSEPSFSAMDVAGSATSRIRGIQPVSAGNVRILLDQVQQREVTGPVDDRTVRDLLLQAVRSQADPGVRFDSVDILKSQTGDDVRDALVFAAAHDVSSGVRLKALQALSEFAADPVVRNAAASIVAQDQDPAVRSQAIDLLISLQRKVQLSPDLVSVLRGVVKSGEGDEYIRLRCYQIIQDLNPSPTVY